MESGQPWVRLLFFALHQKITKFTVEALRLQASVQSLYALLDHLEQAKLAGHAALASMFTSMASGMQKNSEWPIDTSSTTMWPNAQSSSRNSGKPSWEDSESSQSQENTFDLLKWLEESQPSS